MWRRLWRVQYPGGVVELTRKVAGVNAPLNPNKQMRRLQGVWYVHWGLLTRLVDSTADVVGRSRRIIFTEGDELVMKRLMWKVARHTACSLECVLRRLTLSILYFSVRSARSWTGKSLVSGRSSDF